MSVVNLDPYLFFNGNCAEAMEFYKSIFGGKLTLLKFGDMPTNGMENPEEMKDKIMHGFLDAGDVRIMSSDSREASQKAAKIELSISSEDEDKLTGYFNGLSEGGTVRQPLAKAPWGDTFGMLTDKYGIDWMVNITAARPI